MNREFGDYYDNFEAFSNARTRITAGFVEEGLKTIYDLRDYIIVNGDAKSHTWLMPRIESTILAGEFLKFAAKSQSLAALLPRALTI